jgi:hypothetical protein
MPNESKQLGSSTDNESEEPSSHTAESSEAESVGRHDGAKDASGVLSALHDTISTPTKIMDPVPAPVTSEPKTTAKEVHPASNLDSELRQRRAVVEEASQTSEAPSNTADGASIKDKIAKAVSPALAQQPDNSRKNFLQHFFRVVFGPIGRLLTACVGDRKRAR